MYKRQVYVLTCIDHFSKHAWAVAQTKLDSKQTLDGFKKILSRTDGKKPKVLQVDGGIYNDKKLQEYMEEQNIKLKKSSAYTPTENGLVENFNRELRRRIYAGFIRHGNKQWVNYLDDYIKGWNNTKHSTTGFKPNEIYNKRLPKTNMGTRYK